MNDRNHGNGTWKSYFCIYYFIILSIISYIITNIISFFKYIMYLLNGLRHLLIEINMIAYTVIKLFLLLLSFKFFKNTFLYLLSSLKIFKNRKCADPLTKLFIDS